MYGISNLQDLVGLVKEKGSELAAEGKLFADRLSLDRLQEEGGGQAARAGGGKSSGTSAVSQENFLPPRPDIYSAAAVARAREMNVIAAAPSRPSPLPSSLPPARPAPLPPPSIAAEEGKRGNGNAGGRSGRREEEDNEDENDPIMAAIRGGREGGRKGGREEEEEEEVDVEAAVAESLAFLNKKQPAAGAGELPNWQALHDRIRRGEARIARNKQIKEALERKVAGHKNPLQTLTLNYYGGIGKQQQGRLWTDEEDTFLLILMHKFEYGNWERIRMEIRKSEKFCFDWFFKSRTSFELNKRGDTLIKLIEREEAEADGRKPFPSLSHHKRKREVEEGGGEEEEEEEEEVEEEDEMEMDDDELEEEEDEEDEEESRGQEEQSLTSESVSSSTRNTGRLRQSRGGAGSKKTKH
ncbi:hypothetical protein VYU27_006482 [Nannochloropsis oceanica]